MKKYDLKNILVPIDFSEMSERGIEAAQRLAQRCGAAVHLVHVQEYFYPVEFMAPGAPVPMSMVTFRQDDANRTWEQLGALAKRHGIPLTNCHIRNDIPVFHGVCKLAGQMGADLIVMQTHGRTGMAHFFEGSHAERIVQHSPCPVLVARSPEKKPARISSNGKASGRIDTILVPVDFSQSSFAALEYAIEFAELVASKIIVFHAVHLGYAFTADGYGMCDLSISIEAARKAAEDQVQEFARDAKFRGVRFETAVKIAPPVSEICTFADEHDVDLIITATHGRTGLKHLLIGSVAEQVVRRACQPVLVVPSHPKTRTAKLALATRRDQQLMTPSAKNRKVPASPPRVAKRNRKLLAHPFPERRRINKFRESHAD